MNRHFHTSLSFTNECDQCSQKSIFAHRKVKQLISLAILYANYKEPSAMKNIFNFHSEMKRLMCVQRYSGPTAGGHKLQVAFKRRLDYTLPPVSKTICIICIRLHLTHSVDVLRVDTIHSKKSSLCIDSRWRVRFFG